MNYIVATCMALLICGVSYAVLNNKIASKLCFFKPCDDQEEYTSKELTLPIIIIISTLLAVVSFFAVWRIFNYVSDVLGVIKMLVALVCMSGAGCFDFREKRIPNIFPIIMAVAGIILLALGFFTGQDGAMQYAMWNIISAVVCGVLFFVTAFITKQGIGMGDIKLISALALLGGVYVVVGSLLYGVVACTLVAVITLILKKKSIKETLPFGPFLYIGFIATVFLMNF